MQVPSPTPNSRARSRSGESKPRQSSQPALRYAPSATSPSVWDASYVDTFDDEDEPEYTTRSPSAPIVHRFHTNTFNNPWSTAHPPSRSRRASHVRVPTWEETPSPPTQASYIPPNPSRGRADSQSRRHSTPEDTRRPASRNSRAVAQQKRWESDYLRVFTKEYAEDAHQSRRPSHPRRAPDLRMSGALPIPSDATNIPTRLSQHERQERRARTAEWASGDEQRQRTHRRQDRRPKTSNDEEDAQLAKAMRENLRSFAEDQGKGRRRKSLTPWYKQRGSAGNPADEALKERVARSVEEQNREIERRAGEREGGGRRTRARRVRFPDGV
ncbi:hypothetical protein B0T14DRAFT_571261 [Immersiella caudata]|uniref:Uncharacterized protein n=1 Tax=Immersiella caudata TaxID=314043 RepID=A0AA39THI4_9PEZI|nr:hypothetical protein B0T14DRAFT_571261 [Immersiella caudata]